jgi:type IV pilus assembly protein PilN
MTTRINLLPHREERRKRARQHFMATAVLTVIVGLVVVGAVHLYFAERISVQEGRNKFLKDEIARLDKEIAEIRKLKDEITALLERKKIIETLQTDRAQTVHLLDELVRQMPEGVYLKSVTQKGLNVKLDGYAQSNARVSTLMRNIEASPWLESPKLIEVKASNVDKRRVSQFELDLSVKRAEKEEAKDGASSKGAKPAAAKKG